MTFTTDASDSRLIQLLNNNNLILILNHKISIQNNIQKTIIKT